LTPLNPEEMTLDFPPWQIATMYAALRAVASPFGEARDSRESAERLQRLRSCGPSKSEPGPVRARE
jgi:hypothetical protein